ncbi:MarR family winged helix-turn-helix transcriptional regulator [Maritimibacter dapengensis]|uniref:MarR family winged helix-turn-helix transcriptional regulator n=1 Tax=Maritimibacter dapengensis TaxID=2836868 RepID=A0ABS6SWQ2_9RHOB|nr:MarR family winged helix-turn-helix transcriptional regulator [Maritimibacter dapengensis]MBV7377380.1 MarR family winged helix-turn-helix transcriptional regulator [Maritimibacter dapengensis]
MTNFRLEGFLPYKLNELSRAVSGGFSHHYRERYGINVAEWRVVAHLSQEDAVSVREITRRVGMDKPKVSRAASKLEAAGYVTKIENKSDRRLVELRLTKAGREMIETLAPIASAYDEKLRTLLGDDFEAFERGVSKLTASTNSRAET